MKTSRIATTGFRLSTGRTSELANSVPFSAPSIRVQSSQHIKRLIVRIAMYPGGYIDKPYLIDKIRARMIASGASEDEANTHIAANLRLTPNVSERFFTMISRSDAVRHDSA